MKERRAMTKKIKKIGIFLIAIFFTLMQFTTYASAADFQVVTDREYLPDGSYIETEIITEQTRSTITNARKRSTYKSASGAALWYGEVTASFYFDGSTSRCTSASASAGTYSNLWKIRSKSASRSGSTGTATISASSYSTTGAVVGTTQLKVSLSCDKNGNLS